MPLPPPGVSREAMEIHAAAEVVDIHVESFVWTRLFGYRLGVRHGRGALGGRLYSQFDLPRMADGGIDGAVLSIATNPFRSGERRAAVLAANVRRLRSEVDAFPGTTVVSDHGEFVRARATGLRPCYLAVQGGNAVATDRPLDRAISRVTLVHLTNSGLGTTSSPLGGRWAAPPPPWLRPSRPLTAGLTAAGRALVEAMNEQRVVVDLAHISRPGFFGALDVHDRSLPAIVSHTGVRAVHDSWRNLDDEQVRAVAGTGGVVGVMYHSGFLAKAPPLGRVAADAVVRHVAHVIDIGGEDAVALGSDWDGMIITPHDMPTAAELPVLTQRMLDQGFSVERIGKVLGGNYLRVMQQVRPGGFR